MAISIGICDDEKIICGQLETMLLRITKELSVDSSIDVFYTGESLCAELERNRYDLIFLDIELPKMNGVEIGEYIREVLQDDITQIAYISAKDSYAMELFEYRPIHFLTKPLDESKIHKVVEKALQILGDDIQIFTYKKGYEFGKIELSEILYFERMHRKIIITTTSSCDEFYDSLEAVYSRVKNHKFLFIHKSYLVNYRYIKTIRYDKVTMTNGSEFPISQSRRQEIRRMYMNLEGGMV